MICIMDRLINDFPKFSDCIVNFPPIFSLKEKNKGRKRKEEEKLFLA